MVLGLKPSGYNVVEKIDSGDDSSTNSPGVPPYRRGIHPGMYRDRLWTMRQYAGFSSPSNTNKRFKKLLDSGQTGLSIAFDLPTQLGLDSDDELSSGEVGKVGVSIDSIHDMRELFSGIDMGSISTSMTINAPATTLLALYVAVAEEKGISVMMDRCVKIEHARLFGGLNFVGVNTKVISSKRSKRVYN